MAMYYVSKGIYNYLEVTLGFVRDMVAGGDYYKIKMLEENEISSLLRPVSTEIDGQIYLRSNVSLYYILDRMFSNLSPDGEFLKIVMGQLIRCIEELESYLLVPEDLVIKPEYMFYEPKERVLKLVCVPGYGVNVKVQIKDFLEYIMKIFDHRDRKGMLLLYDIYNVVVREDMDIENIKKLLEEGLGEEKQVHYENLYPKEDIFDVKDEKEIISNLLQHKVVVIMIILLVSAGICFTVKYLWFGKKIYDLFIGVGFFVGAVIVAALFSFREEDNLDEIMKEYQEKTVVANIREECDNENFTVSHNPQEESIKKLVPLTNGSLRDIDLSDNKRTIIIGRDKKDTDYRLPTTQISRIHACIYSIGGEVFVEDRDSTNGTFVNNNRIGTLTQHKIKKGDVISFANEEFFAS